MDTRQSGRIGRFESVVKDSEVDIHVYDHHPASEDDVSGSLEMIKPVGATVTILTEIIKERGIELTPDEATILTLGIYEDTGSFTFSSTTPADHQAAPQRGVGAATDLPGAPDPAVGGPKLHHGADMEGHVPQTVRRHQPGRADVRRQSGGVVRRGARVVYHHPRDK